VGGGGGVGVWRGGCGALGLCGAVGGGGFVVGGGWVGVKPQKKQTKKTRNKNNKQQTKKKKKKFVSLVLWGGVVKGSTAKQVLKNR